MSENYNNNVIDFTGPKMASIARQFELHGDEVVAHSIWDMHHLYEQGYLKIVWKDGMPIPTLEKENEVKKSESRVSSSPTS